MASAQQRKRRHERRLAHARRVHGPKAGPPSNIRAGEVVTFIREELGVPVYPHQERAVEALLEDRGYPREPFTATVDGEEVLVTQPARAKCAACGFSQKVTKAGLIGKHAVYIGTDKRACPGSGERPARPQ